jgi:hypothetical protein
MTALSVQTVLPWVRVVDCSRAVSSNWPVNLFFERMLLVLTSSLAPRATVCET